jgi:hypothetical protein
MVEGQHHRVSAKYLYQYANEAAWKEDQRRLSNGTLPSGHSGWRCIIQLAGPGAGTLIARRISRTLVWTFLWTKTGT